MSILLLPGFVFPPTFEVTIPVLAGTRMSPKGKPMGFAGAKILQAECPSCHSTNSVKALKRYNPHGTKRKIN